MVDIKTRIFHETDNQTIGAEVIVYDDTGNKVNSIMVTDQTQFDQLVEQLRVLDETYVTENQLLQILSNAQGTINQINATTLNGFRDTDFAMKNHDHDSKYVGIGHAMGNAPSNYLGTGNLFGHVKVIDNLTQGNYVDGEALAARQGKILNDNISSVNGKFGAWSSVDIATYDSQCLKGYVNPNLRLVFAYVSDAFNYTTKKSNQYIATGEFVKTGYRPKYTVTFASQTPYNVGKIDTDGKIYGKSIYPSNYNGMPLYGSCLWVY